MKTHVSTVGLGRLFLLGAIAAQAVITPLWADGDTTPPALQFTSGLPGKQVRLEWNSSPGLRFVIEKSSTLETGGAGGWTRVALVAATDVTAVWTDPEATTTRAFYRISQPTIAVSSISPPLLSTSGGTLILHGQCIPVGSLLVLDIEGQPSISVPLTDLGGGAWQADFVGAALPGGAIISARIVDGNGITLLTLDQPITVTATGRAEDGPPTLPPASPVPSFQSNPIPGIGIVVKKNPGSTTEARQASDGGGDDDCDGDDLGDDDIFSPLGVAIKTKGTGADNNRTPHDGARRNTPFVSNAHSNPMELVANPAAMPGEVSLQSTLISLPCPVGPRLDWVCTYRSLKPTNSGHGPGWDFSYNIFIETVPAGAGPSASRVVVHDGAGRADTFIRQTNGTYRSDGMFREGSFSGEIFTLTFADKGTWTFKPLNPSATDSGKISAITDRNGVALVFAYNPNGTLASVSDDFGRALSVVWDESATRVLSVSAGSGAAVFLSAACSYSGSGVLESLSCPFIPGQPPVCGPVTFTYSSGSLDPRLNDNLTRFTDGADRSNYFGYSAATSSAAIDYDVCTSSITYGSAASPPFTSSFELLSDGSYLVTQCDEIGRVTESVCDALHRVTSIRQYTGFSTPGTPVTSSTNRPSGKLIPSDPDYFETSSVFNSQHLATRVTYSDGSQDRTTYACDLDRNCPVRERGNPRVVTLATPTGELRTVTCEFQPGFGNPESARPGNPISGLSVKGGKNPGGGIVAQNRPGNPIGGISVKHGQSGRHTPFQNKRSSLPEEKERGITINTSHVEYATSKAYWNVALGLDQVNGEGRDNDCDDVQDDDTQCFARLSMNVTTPEQTQGATFGVRVRKGMQDIKSGVFATRMVSSLGQTTSWTYDTNGNCLSEISPVPNRGTLYQYNARGQCTAATEQNGLSSSFQGTCIYNNTTGFLSSVVCDSGGLSLTRSCLRDELGRASSVTDPRGFNTLYAYNPLHQCVQVRSPAAPHRITTTLTIDAGGRPARVDVEHRAPDGSLVPSNPAYSTFYQYDSSGQFVRCATEERPVDGSATLDPATLGIENFAVCDITYDAAGQITRVSTPAACRAQATDRATSFSYNERGLLHRCIQGDTGNPAATDPVTTEWNYDAFGSLTRCTTLGNGLPDSEILYTYDGFHRPASITDPMGNLATFDYENNGYVTVSKYGEVLDLAGSENNVLLSRTTSSLSPIPGGGPAGPVCLTLPGIADACWDIKPSKGSSSRRRVEVLKSNKQGDPNASRDDFVHGDIRQPVVIGAALSARLAIKTKGTSAKREMANPFFILETEDDTITTERFTPGGTSALEVTTIDRSPAGLVQSVSVNGDTLVDITYDSAGRSTGWANGACSRTVTRDANGQILVCGDTAHFSVAGTPSKTFTMTRVLDAIGRCTQLTDGIGNTAHFALDSLSRCVEETEPGGLVVHTDYDGFSIAGAFSSQVSADFDGDGSLEVIGSSLVRCGELVSTTDAHGFPTTFSVDALGRFVRVDHPDDTFETSSFDSRGFRTQRTFADGATQNCVHDLNGRVTAVEWSNIPSGVVAVAAKTVQYDGIGNLTSCIQGSSTVTATYDSCGDQTSETQSGLTISRTFNHRGCTSITYPDGKHFQESRNAFGELVSVTELTPLGVEISPPIVSQDYLGHQVCRTVQRNGVTTTFAYRADGESSPAGSEDLSFGSCVRETVTAASAVVLSDNLVCRDANQRTCSSTQDFSVLGEEKSRFTVTPRDRFGNIAACVISHRDSAVAPPVIESSVSYTYDIDGTRLAELRNGVAGDYTKSEVAPSFDLQMAQYSTWPGGSLTWDPNGNIDIFQKGSSELTFVHDVEGRVVSVTDGEGEVVAYSYDSVSRRSARVGRNPQTGRDKRLIYNGPTCIQELGTDNLADMTFVCAAGIRQCISTRNGTIYYPHQGISGRYGNSSGGGIPYVAPCDARLTAISDAAGVILERFDYDDAGKPNFLTAEGLPSSDSGSSSGLRWLSPDCAWEPEIGMFTCPDGFYSPDLGQTVTSAKKKVKFKAGSELAGSVNKGK